MLIPIPRESREAVALIVDGDPDQALLALGRLGAIDGGKAVNLTQSPDAGLIEGLERMMAMAEGKS